MRGCRPSGSAGRRARGGRRWWRAARCRRGRRDPPGDRRAVDLEQALLDPVQGRLRLLRVGAEHREAGASSAGPRARCADRGLPLEPLDAHADRGVGVERRRAALGQHLVDGGAEGVAARVEQGLDAGGEGGAAVLVLHDAAVLVGQHVPRGVGRDHGPQRAGCGGGPGDAGGVGVGLVLLVAVGRRRDGQVAPGQQAHQPADGPTRALRHRDDEVAPPVGEGGEPGVAGAVVAELVREHRAQLAAGQDGEQRQPDEQLAAAADLVDRGVHGAVDHDPARHGGLQPLGEAAHLLPQPRVLVLVLVEADAGERLRTSLPGRAQRGDQPDHQDETEPEQHLHARADHLVAERQHRQGHHGDEQADHGHREQAQHDQRRHRAHLRHRVLRVRPARTARPARVLPLTAPSVAHRARPRRTNPERTH